MWNINKDICDGWALKDISSVGKISYTELLWGSVKYITYPFLWTPIFKTELVSTTTQFNDRATTALNESRTEPMMLFTRRSVPNYTFLYTPMHISLLTIPSSPCITLIHINRSCTHTADKMAEQKFWIWPSNLQPHLGVWSWKSLLQTETGLAIDTIAMTLSPIAMTELFAHWFRGALKVLTPHIFHIKESILILIVVQLPGKFSTRDSEVI